MTQHSSLLHLPIRDSSCFQVQSEIKSADTFRLIVVRNMLDRYSRMVVETSKFKYDVRDIWIQTGHFRVISFSLVSNKVAATYVFSLDTFCLRKEYLFRYSLYILFVNANGSERTKLFRKSTTEKEWIRTTKGKHTLPSVKSREPTRNLPAKNGFFIIFTCLISTRIINFWSDFHWTRVKKWPKELQWEQSVKPSFAVRRLGLMHTTVKRIWFWCVLLSLLLMRLQNLGYSWKQVSTK